MATIFIDKSDGMLAVSDSYEVKEKCSAAGCFWDGETKLWKMAFTISTFENLIKRIPEAKIDPSLFKEIQEQKEKEDKLAEIRKKAKANEDIVFRIPGVKINPFPYQKLGILYSVINGKGMLIGDSMGLGKSNQAICTAIMMKNKGIAKSCLVITPASLKFNWPLEIEKFTNETCIVIDGKKPEERISQWQDTSCFFKIANYELVVEDLFGGREYKAKENETAEQTKKRVAKKIKQLVKQKQLQDVKDKVWDLVILDECHYLKHSSSRRYKAVKGLKAKMKIGLSGTPMDGRLEELYTVMSIIAPGILGSHTSFFNRYVTTDFFGAVKGYKNIQEVQDKIAPFFIRRLKKDVLEQLPDKLYENKIIALTEEEKKIYKQIKKGTHPCVINKDGSIAEPMVRAIRCMQFVNFPQMIDPNCKNSTKLDVFKEVLEEIVQLNGQKVIIFTQFKQILNLVEQILKDMKLKFLRIDGDTDKKLRADYQKMFNEDTSIDCIIGTDAMSTGLNLIGGDMVLNLTQCWQPATMSQREDRAYRIGRKENVTVLNFLCKDTIEEKIRKALYSKDKITADTLGDDTDEAVLMKLGPQEIEELM